MADRMLGKLGRYLRMMGYDVSYPPPSPDSSLMATARKEGRILLTRDRGISRSESAHKGSPIVVEIRSANPLTQLRQLLSEGWISGIGQPRCPACNTPPEEVPLEKARHMLHPFTVAIQVGFLYCPSCNILLWEGSHWEHFQESISQIFHNGLEPSQKGK